MYRPWLPTPGEHLVIDWGQIGPLHIFSAVLVWSRIRFVRFALDERRETTLRLLAECFEELGGVPAVVLADRMACLKAGVVANVVVPHPEYVRFAMHFGFRPDFCESHDPESNRTDWFADDERLVRWIETRRGQHIELGISEVNMVGLLAELGLTWARHGEPLLPIGTLYDIFLGRALEPWAFGHYAGGQSIIVGTPSGVTLAPEGGAHHSVTTPSIGLEQPRCIAWEPAFGKDLEWILLYALSLLGRQGGTSSYIRLTTRPIDQSLNPLPVDSKARDTRRQLVLSGGYRLREADTAPQVVLATSGAVIPEVLEAADELGQEMAVDVVCITSGDRLFRAWRAQQGFGTAEGGILDALFPLDRKAPIVSVLDGHPHTLAFLGSLRGTPMACLGVDDFGQSGDVPDLYRHFQIDTESIVDAALDLVS